MPRLPEEFSNILKVSPRVITQPSENVINDIKDVMNILNIEEIENYKELITTNNEALALNEKKLKRRIGGLKDFLNIDEKSTIFMVKSQPMLLTMPMFFF